MSSPKNQEFVIAQRPKGKHDVKEAWKLQDTAFPKINAAGDFIYETLYISVDPYLSSSLNENSALGGAARPLGTPQTSLSTAKVIESKNADFPVGTIFVTELPWSRYGLGTSRGFSRRVKIVKKPGDPENSFDRLGLSSTLGSLGMPSQTAYYGATEVGKFKESDVVVVSGAAGATGSVVGQIAKKIQKAKKVIGVAGGKEKCAWLKELGFDETIDYKEYNTKEKVAARLKELAGADPITSYFDNTGGFVTDAIFDVIARHGRLIICGQISAYHTTENPEEANKYPNYLSKVVYPALSILGFLVSDFVHRNDTEFFVDFAQWVEKGIIKTRETLVEGFEKLPEAYEMLYTGANTGKIVVKV